MKALMRVVGFMIVVGTIAGLPLFLFLEFHAPLIFAYEEQFIISKLDSKREIVEKLEEGGYIRSAVVFHLIGRLKNNRTFLAPGGYTVSKDMNAWEIVEALVSKTAVWVTLSEGLTKADIAATLSDAVDWSPDEQARFVRTFAAIQWNAFNADLLVLVAEKLTWDNAEQKAFATMSAFFSDEEYDFLRDAYVPQDYLISLDDSIAQIAGQLVEVFLNGKSSSVRDLLASVVDYDVLVNVSELVRGEVELLPDLTPLPPSDIVLENRGSRTLLLFTTTYWNQGKGPFELVADPQTSGIAEDIERNVFQRIYRVDNMFRNHKIGTFLWEQEHLHYHYNDFVDYTFESVVIEEGTFSVAREKATFCIRDIEPIDTYINGASGSAGYRICGKERQGISVGWGDSYYYTYPDQFIDVTNAPKGEYRLSFEVNPRQRFEEITLNNNTSSVLLSLDVASSRVEILEKE